VRAAYAEDILSEMQINDPATVAELRELYPRYEQALVSNDVETLMTMFWASPYVARFGPTETLYGIKEIEAFRKGRSPANLARTITRLEIVTFGKDFASITVVFERDIAGGVGRGRQSQTWARLPEGWRIVFAHVSLLV
jgi:phenylpyruvate tautomerase PptA (4-oxalocrotonate tautomerase family)